MFGDNDNTWGLAGLLLEWYTLEELLELNDLTEEELVVHLLETGIIVEPRSVIEGYEEDVEETD